MSSLMYRFLRLTVALFALLISSFVLAQNPPQATPAAASAPPAARAAADPATTAAPTDTPAPGVTKAVPVPATAPAPATSVNAVIDRVFYNEARLFEQMHKYQPLVETYIQNLKPDSDLGRIPGSDKYFLGRMVLTKGGIERLSYDKRKGVLRRVVDRLTDFYKMNYLPMGFMQVVFLADRFDKQNYDLQFRRREFLGEVRCLVFDVTPRPKVKGPHFVGRIWVEDEGDNIVRINGTYAPERRFNYFFHFDTWRMNLQPGLWLPALVYTEESDAKYDVGRTLMMKGQTRLWGYNLTKSANQSEFSDIQVDDPSRVRDQSNSADNNYNPVQSQHMWEQQAEDNILERMQRAGVLAPAGDVSSVLETVVNNLVITNKLNVDPPVRCRVLLTTPLESFTVGHTIVISRGLLDVLPDEASLAMVLSHELAHVVLDHGLDTKYAFLDRLLFPDEDTFRSIHLKDSDKQEDAADQKALVFLRNSPYANKLANAGLFLKALENSSPELTNLISPHFGNRLVKGKSVLRMEALMQAAPQLKVRDPQQLPALPLGSRIKLDPWTDHLELQKTGVVPLRSARDKMSFEVTPAFPMLSRYKEATAAKAAAAPVAAQK